MPNITKETIRALKENVKISSVFEWLGAKVVPKSNGKAMVFCPFCADSKSRNPGCSLNDMEGLYHCFVCQESGDMISAVQNHENCSFPEAVELLAKQFKIPLKYDSSSDPEAETKRRKLISILEAANAMFLKQREDHHFVDFLESRHLSYETADAFDLGMSLYTKADEMVAELLEDFDADSLIECGLCYKDEKSGNPVLRFKNRLIYPIRTAPGTLVGFGGRDLTGRSKAKYVNSPESDLFKKRNVLYGLDKAKKAINRERKVIVCEGYMDTIALQSHGYDYSVGVMGTALTDRNLSYLSNFADTLYLSLDADQAGVNAAMRVANEIPNGFRTDVRVVSIPRDVAKDPDEFFNQQNKTTFDFQEILNSSEDIFLFCVKNQLATVLEKLTESLTSDDPGKASSAGQLKAEAKRIAAKFMSNHMDRATLYQRKAAAEYLIEKAMLIETYEQLDQQWEKQRQFDRVKGQREKIEETVPTFSSSSSIEEDILIGALYYHPEARDEVKKNLSVVENVFTSETRKSIFDKISDAIGMGKTPKEATDDFNATETKELARILMEPRIADGKDSHGGGAVESICQNVKKKALSNAILRESESPMPDLMKILKMKTELSKMI